ncbi:MAG: 4-hydroxy-tetrahydrodipicolinate reductase [Clostridiales bacterium]|nr:4-hydroxy-tetrahydrodipicolinate reductase [Clostridiales bacterium]
MMSSRTEDSSMKVIINGIDGAMGKILSRIIAETDDMEVIAGVTPTGADGAFLKMDDYQGPADMVIDFSHHSVTKELMDYCVAHKLPVVVCTTGQTEDEMQYIADAAASIPVFKSANMSVGVALVAKVVKEVAAKFGKCDVEIVETHHNRKVDAPSGTALMLADAVIEARPELHYNTGRSGQAKRQPDEIGISAVRMGNIVGTHEVMFGTASQTISITHQAHDRALFADGAVAAARFLAGKPAGMYDMNDLLAD